MGLLVVKEHDGKLVFTIDPLDLERLEEYIVLTLGLGC